MTGSTAALAAILVLVGGFTVLIAAAGRDRDNKFDERQLIEQGRGCKYSLISMLVYIVLEPFAELIARHKFMDAQVSLYLCGCLGVAVLVVYCIIKDAYVTVKKSPWVKTGAMGILAAGWSVIALTRLDDGLMEDGMLTRTWVYLALAADFVAVFVTLLLKTLLDRRNRE